MARPSRCYALVAATALVVISLAPVVSADDDQTPCDDLFDDEAPDAPRVIALANTWHIQRPPDFGGCIEAECSHPTMIMGCMRTCGACEPAGESDGSSAGSLDEEGTDASQIAAPTAAGGGEDGDAGDGEASLGEGDVDAAAGGEPVDNIGKGGGGAHFEDWLTISVPPVEATDADKHGDAGADLAGSGTDVHGASGASDDSDGASGASDDSDGASGASDDSGADRAGGNRSAADLADGSGDDLDSSPGSDEDLAADTAHGSDGDDDGESEDADAAGNDAASVPDGVDDAGASGEEDQRGGDGGSEGEDGDPCVNVFDEEPSTSTKAKALADNFGIRRPTDFGTCAEVECQTSPAYLMGCMRTCHPACSMTAGASGSTSPAANTTSSEPAAGHASAEVPAASGGASDVPASHGGGAYDGPEVDNPGEHVDGPGEQVDDPGEHQVDDPDDVADAPPSDGASPHFEDWLPSAPSDGSGDTSDPPPDEGAPPSDDGASPPDEDPSPDAPPADEEGGVPGTEEVGASEGSSPGAADPDAGSVFDGPDSGDDIVSDRDAHPLPGDGGDGSVPPDAPDGEEEDPLEWVDRLDLAPSFPPPPIESRQGGTGAPDADWGGAPGSDWASPADQGDAGSLFDAPATAGGVDDAWDGGDLGWGQPGTGPTAGSGSQEWPTLIGDGGEVEPGKAGGPNLARQPAVIGVGSVLLLAICGLCARTLGARSEPIDSAPIKVMNARPPGPMNGSGGGPRYGSNYGGNGARYGDRWDDDEGNGGRGHARDHDEDRDAADHVELGYMRRDGPRVHVEDRYVASPGARAWGDASPQGDSRMWRDEDNGNEGGRDDSEYSDHHYGARRAHGSGGAPGRALGKAGEAASRVAAAARSSSGKPRYGQVATVEEDDML